MVWYSIYGTGATLYGIERRNDGRVEFTAWLSVFRIPVLPLSSWSAVYTGECPPNGITDESHCFVDLERIPHDWPRVIQTFALGLLAAVVAVAPSAFMIWFTNGRAATNVEMVFVFGSALCSVGVVIASEHLRRDRLSGA